MSSPNDVSMEEIPLEDDERDSIEYRILMAYAQRRLSVSKYRKLLKNEANVHKSSSSIRRKVKTDHQRRKDGPDGPSRRRVLEVPVIPQSSKEQPKAKYLPRFDLDFFRHFEDQGEPLVAKYQGGGMARSGDFVVQSAKGPFQHKTSETADVNHIADKLAKFVTSKSQESPSDAILKPEKQALRLLPEKDSSGPADGSESEEHDKEKIIQTIVSLLRQSGDQLEEKIQKDRVLLQHFRDMLSYNFFERITDLFLEGVSAGSTTEPRGQAQCAKLAFTMEVVTRLTAVDNHPMNLVLGFGLKYLREHFKPWIQDQGGWEKALTSLDEEEVE